MCANKTFGKKIQEGECPKYHQSMRKQTIENIKYSSYLLQHKTHASKSLPKCHWHNHAYQQTK
jgi:hypothetical protein